MASPKLPDKLRGRKEKSFAYDTLRQRLPDIVTKVIDHVHRSWNDFDMGARNESSDVINRLAAIKYELERNRALTPVVDGRPDNKVWNDILVWETEKLQGVAPTYFDTPWLYSECFVYRKIAESFAFCASMTGFDWFGKQKKSAFTESIEATCLLGEAVESMSTETPPSQSTLTKMLKVCLWGNKCDLSISCGVSNSQIADPLDQLTSLDPNILRDDSPQLYSIFTQDCGKAFNLDVVLDNSGFELVTDLMLCFYLLKTLPYIRITLHAKQLPWFVSDALHYDVTWTLHQMTKANNEKLLKIATFLNEQIYETSRLRIVADMFWTLPCSIDEMKTYDKLLYRQLSVSNLVMFKGDLNYRKISQDREWDPSDTSFTPDFHVPICALRTLKADTAFGIPEDKVTFAKNSDPKWMISANFGVIHFMDCSES